MKLNAFAWSCKLTIVTPSESYTFSQPHGLRLA